jgi:hypothetical protein
MVLGIAFKTFNFLCDLRISSKSYSVTFHLNDCLANNKHFSFLDQLVSFKENKVLVPGSAPPRFQPQDIRSLTGGPFIKLF